MPNPKEVADAAGADGSALTEAISAAMVGADAEFYPHDRPTATTPRRVVASLSANQAVTAVACELICLDATPLAAQIRIGARDR